MKKRYGALLLAAIVFLGLCTSGCRTAEKMAQPVTITLWHYYNGAQKTAFDQLVDEFNITTGKENGVAVRAFNRGNIGELGDGVIASANNTPGSDPIPDIFSAYADTVSVIDHMGLLAGLDSYFTPEELAEYVPAYIEEGRLGTDRALKIMPTAKTTEVLLLNKTAWDSFSEETKTPLALLDTVEGLTEVAARYYRWTDAQTPAVSDDGKAFFGRDAMANYLLIGSKQLGADLFSTDESGAASICVEKTAMRQLWDHYYVPYVNGWFTAKGRFRTDDARVGDVIALVGSATSATFFPTEVTLNDKDSYPIESIAMPVPCFANAPHYAVQQGAGMAVTKSTPEKERAAALFLKWFTESERNLRFSVASGYLPVKIAANEPDKLEQAIAAEESLGGEALLAKTLRVALQTITTHDLCAFEGSNEARQLLNNTLQERARADAAQVQARVESGMSREQAAAELCTDENFEIWLGELCRDLQRIREGMHK